MDLSSGTGTRLRLSPARYQFPSADNEWDLNWLVVEGHVVSGAKTWAFRDPCLTTWEARELGAWLAGVGNGTVAAEDRAASPDDEPSLAFTEPNLGFSLRRRDEHGVVLCVHLSLEALPPELQDGNMYQHVIELTLSTADITKAGAEWAEELVAFPERDS